VIRKEKQSWQSEAQDTEPLQCTITWDFVEIKKRKGNKTKRNAITQEKYASYGH